MRRLEEVEPSPAGPDILGTLRQLYEDNLALLRSILERAASAKQRDAVDQKIGDLYGSCMDEATVNRRAVSPIKELLDAVAGAKTMHDLVPVLAQLQMRILNGEVLFGPGSIQDPDNSDQQIAAVDQGGLGPARSRLLHQR